MNNDVNHTKNGFEVKAMKSTSDKLKSIAASLEPKKELSIDVVEK